MQSVFCHDPFSAMTHLSITMNGTSAQGTAILLPWFCPCLFCADARTMVYDRSTAEEADRARDYSRGIYSAVQCVCVCVCVCVRAHARVHAHTVSSWVMALWHSHNKCQGCSHCQVCMVQSPVAVLHHWLHHHLSQHAANIFKVTSVAAPPLHDWYHTQLLYQLMNWILPSSIQPTFSLWTLQYPMCASLTPEPKHNTTLFSRGCMGTERITRQYLFAYWPTAPEINSHLFQSPLNRHH
jgi:hypothetical protein